MKAILRTQKLKSLGNIAGAAAHVTRSRTTPNADPTKKNVILYGGNNIFKDIKKMMPDVLRINGVLAVEILLTASPEFFHGKNKKEIMTWAQNSLFSQQKFWGEKNVASAILHLDESTPHIHLFAVPKIGDKLNCRAYLGGRKKMQDLQTHYAKDMKKFGLERGVEGSTQKHVTMKKIYGAMNEIETPSQKKVEILMGENKMLGKAKTEHETIYNKNSVDQLLIAAKKLKFKIEKEKNANLTMKSELKKTKNNLEESKKTINRLKNENEYLKTDESIKNEYALLIGREEEKEIMKNESLSDKKTLLQTTLFSKSSP